MKYKIILITFLNNLIFGMDEINPGNKLKLSQLLTEYSQFFGHFKGLSLSPLKNNHQIAMINSEDDNAKYPLSDKYPLNLLPNSYGADQFKNDDEKHNFAKHYFTNLEKILQDKSNQIIIEDGKIKSSLFEGAIFSRSLLEKETSAEVITKMHLASLTTLPKCYSDYDQFKKLKANYTIIDAIYNWRHNIYKNMQLEKTYSNELERCEKLLTNNQNNTPLNLEITNKANSLVNYIDTVMKDNINLNKEILKKSELIGYKEDAIKKLFNSIYKDHEINTKDFEDIKHTLNIQYHFYKNSNVEEKLLNEYQNKLEIFNNIDGIFLEYKTETLVDKIFYNKNYNKRQFENNYKGRFDNFNNQLNDCKTSLEKLIELDNEIQSKISYCHLKWHVRIQDENEKILECKDYKSIPKPFYRGAFAHLTNSYSYNIKSKKFIDTGITTGIVHTAGISFETDQSPWFNYFIKKTGDTNLIDDIRYQFRTHNNSNLEKLIEEVNQNENDIKEKMEELYNDINYRIFDTFSAAFKLAQKNKKTNLWIKMPYIGMGNFLNEIRGTNIEAFVVGCYYKSFISNFKYFYENRTKYNIDNFKIIFGDGDTEHNTMNENLRQEVDQYIEDFKLSENLKNVFNNNFITDKDTVDIFNINGVEKDNKTIVVFVRPGDEYANYLNGALNEAASLELNFLGVPAYGKFPQIIFPEIIATPILGSLFELELFTEKSINKDRSKSIMPYDNLQPDLFLIPLKKEHKVIVNDSFLECEKEAEYNINYDDKIITFPQWQFFISGGIKASNPGARGGSETPTISLFIEKEIFAEYFINMLKELTNNNEEEEYIIDIDDLLESHKNSCLKKDHFENLIDNAVQIIINMINKNSLSNIIKIKYNNFYYNRIKIAINKEYSYNSNWSSEKNYKNWEARYNKVLDHYRQNNKIIMLDHKYDAYFERIELDEIFLKKDYERSNMIENAQKRYEKYEVNLKKSQNNKEKNEKNNKHWKIKIPNQDDNLISDILDKINTFNQLIKCSSNFVVNLEKTKEMIANIKKLIIIKHFKI